MLRKKINFKKRVKELQKNYLMPYGLSIQLEIRKNTASGKDKNGKSFKPYSKSYQEYIKKGYHKEKKSTHVNLQSSGEMLRSIDFDVIKGGLRFYLKGNRKSGLSNNDVAYYNKKNGREFLGLPEKREKEIKKDLAEIIKGVLKT